MDILLLPYAEWDENWDVIRCFNPCFNGYTTFTRWFWSLYIKIRKSFNPCFNGYTTFTIKDEVPEEETSVPVSILVLMDILLLQ